MVVAGPSHLFRHEARPDGDVLVPTDLVRGPWDPTLLHGGAVSGALTWAIVRERARLGAAVTAGGGSPNGGSGAAAGDSSQLCRLTVEILRPVPVGPLAVAAETVRAGRRSQVLSAELRSGESTDGQLVARASSLWSQLRPRGRAAPVQVPVDAAVPRRPTIATDPGASAAVGYPRPGFNCDVFELRCLVGSTEDPGPGVVWTRLKTGLVEGHPTGPVELLGTVADLANAVGWDRSPNGQPMINPDLTLQVLRYPRGEWVCLDARPAATAEGIGMMETTLWDGDGRFGRVLSTTVESPVSLAVDL
ncbi:MAG: thioesterase family protein [Actinomycetota bacterium]